VDLSHRQPQFGDEKDNKLPTMVMGGEATNRWPLNGPKVHVSIMEGYKQTWFLLKIKQFTINSTIL
jgi:hypothetical protein